MEEKVRKVPRRLVGWRDNNFAQVGEVGEVGTGMWEGVRGCGRMWEGVGGCERVWEGVGGCMNKHTVCKEDGSSLWGEPEQATHTDNVAICPAKTAYYNYAA